MTPLFIPEVSDLDIAFSKGHFTPEWDSIPNEFKGRGNPYEQLFCEMFYSGYDLSKLKVKEGVDKAKNVRFLKHCMSTFSTKHEHKTAACSWILSETFELPSLTNTEKKGN